MVKGIKGNEMLVACSMEAASPSLRFHTAMGQRLATQLRQQQYFTPHFLSSVSLIKHNSVSEYHTVLKCSQYFFPAQLSQPSPNSQPY
jgi:hypothetical protein